MPQIRPNHWIDIEIPTGSGSARQLSGAGLRSLLVWAWWATQHVEAIAVLKTYLKE